MKCCIDGCDREVYVGDVCMAHNYKYGMFNTPLDKSKQANCAYCKHYKPDGEVKECMHISCFEDVGTPGLGISGRNRILLKYDKNPYSECPDYEPSVKGRTMRAIFWMQELFKP